MAVPKTTQTRYMDGSVQRTTQVTPSLHLFFFKEHVSKLCCEITGNIFVQKTKMKKRCRDGVTCVVLCTLPSIYLVCVVLALPSLHPSTFWKMFFILCTMECYCGCIIRCECVLVGHVYSGNKENQGIYSI